MNENRAVKIAFVAALLFCLLPFIVQSLAVLAYRYEADDSEGVVLNQGWQILHGEDIYGRIDRYPFVTAVYPPLFPLAAALMIKLAGPRLLAGRLISFFSSLLLLLILFFVIKKKTAGYLPSLLCVSLLVSLFPFQNWACLCRVDLLAILFSFSALAVYLLAGESVLADEVIAGLMLLGLFTKQTALAVPATLLLHLIFTGKGKRAARIFLPLFALFASVFSLLLLITQGRYFSHTVLYVANAYSLPDALAIFWRTICNYPLFAVLAAALTFDSARKKDLLFPVYLAASFLVGLLSGKTGANYNFWLEFCIGFSVLASLAAARVMDRPEVRAFSASSRSVFLLAVAAQLLFASNYWLISRDYQNNLRTLSGEGDFISSFIKTVPGPVLTETAGLSILNGKPFLLEPFGMKVLAEEGLWDESPVLRDLNAQKFDLIAIKSNKGERSSRFTPKMLAAMKAHYVRLAVSPHWELLRPRDRKL
ncbi:MAG TPA: hypothetical protein VMD02_05400 [Candidatus Omnitrophota bacterium]|nr:hypothetical protein [Candidatus Omnitrophota bacterium]